MRIHLAAAVVAASAVLAGSGGAAAQSGCQPTIMQPCTNQPTRPNGQPPGQRNSAQADEDKGEPRDHSPHVPLDKDTDFKFGTGGIGIGRKF
jgi:hypothetical protein